jgi:hypothetical protein
VGISFSSHTRLTVLNSFDYNDQNGGTSFKARHPNWRRAEIMDDFAKWGAESFGGSLFCLKRNALTQQHLRDLSGQRERG